MNISIWRYSHLTLAISSFIFILIATITGIVLAFEPISNKLKPYAVNTNDVFISETITTLQKEYDEIITLEVNQHNFVTASVITKDGKNETFYVNPKSGKKISAIIPKAQIYKFATNLHRSLFLKSTGRILVAFFSFLLLLITVTGFILITKRQGGLKKIFSKVIYEDFNTYYHVILSRWFLVPIVIITLTGVYLSLEKFSLLPETKTKHNYNSDNKTLDTIPIAEFNVFKNNKLAHLKSLEFPFSDDEEDYFFLKLKNKELLVNQYSGRIISNKELSWVKIASNWSLFLHTGRGSILWSLVLLITCFAILFFIFSGFKIALNRRKKNSTIKNNFKKDNAEFVILVGSETGNTFNIANSFYKALLEANKTVFIDSLNNYTSYKKVKYLIIFTATYGDGEAPTNASKFLNLIHKNQQTNNLQYAVIGFGSLAYKAYCQFAIEIDNEFSKINSFTPILPITKINNQNFTTFKTWVLQFNEKMKTSLAVKQQTNKPIKEDEFTIISKTDINIDDTFLIRIRPNKKIKFNSGDLLAITPKKDNVKRLYSIGKIENDILLSIKKHEFGVCSNLLFNLKKNRSLKAKLEINTAFHFPKKAKEVILIANGTGIAPFLGKQKTTTKTHIFLGLRTNESINVYAPYLPSNNIRFAFSKQGNKEYVQDLLINQEELIISILKNKGMIMICGSITMMKAVLNTINRITLKHLNTNIDEFKSQIKTDCY